jgi:hypothetical protein
MPITLSDKMLRQMLMGLGVPRDKIRRVSIISYAKHGCMRCHVKKKRPHYRFGWCRKCYENFCAEIATLESEGAFDKRKG